MSVRVELEAFAEQLEAQRGLRERLLASQHAGVRTHVDLVRLVERSPDLGTPEPFLAAAEQLAPPAPKPSESSESAESDAKSDATSDSETKSEPESEIDPSQRALAAGLLDWLSFCRSAEAEARARNGLRASTVSVELEVLPFADAESELLTCTHRVRRQTLFRGVQSAHASVEADLSERIERRLEVWTRLDRHEESKWSWLFGIDVPELASAAEALLRETKDAAFDLLDYHLRRERSDAEVGSGSRAELELAMEMLSLREHFSPGQLWLVVGQLAESLGIDALVNRAISTDLEPRKNRRSGLLVAPFRVPGEIAVVLSPERTPTDLDRLLLGMGQAWHWAHIDAELPIEQRVLLDPAFVRMSGATIASVLEEASWHRRVLRSSSKVSAESAQAFALRHLLELRLAAARFLSARELFRHGPTNAVREGFRERMSAAAGMDYGFVGWLDVDVIELAAELRGRAWAAHLGEQLVENFDEDYWRNPRTGEFLRELWREGGALSTDALGGKPQLARAGSRLLARAVR
jgi:hypothetical protein